LPPFRDKLGDAGFFDEFEDGAGFFPVLEAPLPTVAEVVLGTGTGPDCYRMGNVLVGIELMIEETLSALGDPPVMTVISRSFDPVTTRATQ